MYKKYIESLKASGFELTAIVVRNFEVNFHFYVFNVQYTTSRSINDLLFTAHEIQQSLRDLNIYHSVCLGEDCISFDF